MAHLMKCALINMKPILSKPSMRTCATTWNVWRVNPDVSQEGCIRWLRTCNSLCIVTTTDNWPSDASQNMHLTWLTSFVLYLRHSQIWKQNEETFALANVSSYFCRGGEIWTLDLTDPNREVRIPVLARMFICYFLSKPHAIHPLVQQFVVWNDTAMSFCVKVVILGTI